jgi:hypothetical protein
MKRKTLEVSQFMEKIFGLVFTNCRSTRLLCVWLYIQSSERRPSGTAGRNSACLELTTRYATGTREVDTLWRNWHNFFTAGSNSYVLSQPEAKRFAVPVQLNVIITKCEIIFIYLKFIQISDSNWRDFKEKRSNKKMLFAHEDWKSLKLTVKLLLAWKIFVKEKET